MSIETQIEQSNRARAAAREQFGPAIHVIVDTIRLHPGTDKVKILVHFLNSLVVSRKSGAFDLNQLRWLDLELSNACLAVLSWHRFSEVNEILRIGAFSEEELSRWVETECAYRWRIEWYCDGVRADEDISD